jgi:hypothetical protein
VLITATGAALVALIGRRRAVMAAGGNGAASVPVEGTPEELERLRRELSEVED